MTSLPPHPTCRHHHHHQKKKNPVLVGLLSKGSSNLCCVGSVVISVRYIMRRENHRVHGVGLFNYY